MDCGAAGGLFRHGGKDGRKKYISKKAQLEKFSC